MPTCVASLSPAVSTYVSLLPAMRHLAGSHVLQHVRLALHSRLLSNAQKEASNACASCLPPDSFLQLPDLWLPAPSLAILCQPVLGHQSCCPHSQSVHCSRQKQAAGHGVPSGYQVSQFQTLSRLQLACAPQILAPQRNRLSLNPYESQQQRGYAVVSKTETSDLPGLIEELQRQQVGLPAAPARKLELRNCKDVLAKQRQPPPHRDMHAGPDLEVPQIVQGWFAKWIKDCLIECDCWSRFQMHACKARAIPALW